MHKSIWATALIATALAASAPANAQDGRVFAASSAWALDYGEDYCRLMRDFEDEGDTVGLFIERIQPGPMLRLIVIGDEVKLYRRAETLGFRLLPAGAPRTAQMLRYQTGDGQQYLNLGPAMLQEMPAPPPGAPPAMPARYSPQSEAETARAITGIALESGLTSPVTLETGSLEGAIGALQSCADDLLVSWGLDAQAHKLLTRPAMPSIPTAGWIKADTIDFADFAKLSGGNNEVRLMVNSAGEVTSCHIHWPTLDSHTNSEICELVQENAQMLPAMDGSGQVIDSYWIANVFFLFPPFGG